jgi:hypothetical protein
MGLRLSPGFATACAELKTYEIAGRRGGVVRSMIGAALRDVPQSSAAVLGPRRSHPLPASLLDDRFHPLGYAREGLNPRVAMGT